MTLAPLSEASALARAGRQPELPFRLLLDSGGSLTMLRLLRVLPGKRLVGEAEARVRRVFAKVFLGARSEQHWQQECAGLAALRQAGVPTPELLAAAPLPGGGHVLLTDFLAAAESLAEAWARVADRPAGDAAAQALLTPALALLGRLHAAGLTQEDLHFGNFLRCGDALFLVDGDAVRVITPGQPLPAARAVANLAIFLAQLPPAWDAHLETLLPAYAASAGAPHTAALAADPAGESLADSAHRRPAPSPALLRAIEGVRNWRLKDFLAKSVRECSLFSVERSFWRFSSVVRRHAERLAPVLADPDGVLARGSILKDGGTVTVARVQLGDGEVLIKRYNLKGFAHACSRLWRPSRAWHSWRAAHCLQFLGFHTPAPLALIEERYGPWRRRAWLISEFSPGPNLQTHLSPFADPPTAEANALRTLFAGLHAQRISHGDLKAMNLLWDGARIALIDLDAVVHHRSPATYRRAWRRDRARLLRNWPPDSPLHLWLDAHLPAG